MQSNRPWLFAFSAVIWLNALAANPSDPASSLATATVAWADPNSAYLADGQLEAVRQSTIAAQVAGTVLARTVRAGDTVKAGQVLVRIDPSAALQSQAASAAQLAAAQAQQAAAGKALERTRQLVSQNYVSPANLDKAEADYKAAKEAVRALSAQNAGAAAQTGWRTLVAPFDSVVTSTFTEIGDIAMPGKPLIQLHDPRALRVAMNLPAGIVARLQGKGEPQITIPDAGPSQRTPKAGRLVVVSSADPVSHTQRAHIDLPSGLEGLHPGMFARIELALRQEPGWSPRLVVPASALIARGDLRAVYVQADPGFL
ncbi:MAG: efflux RND transporter periplasmic adaptor subunit, partial [Quisquiliibacterium sp.]